MPNIFLIPSIYASSISGFLILVALILFLRNVKQIQKIDTYKFIMLLLGFSLVIGVHGLSHLGLETIYGYNPMLLLSRQ
jgi:hypothetical protein